MKTGVVIAVVIIFAVLLLTEHYISTIMFAVGIVGLYLTGGMGRLPGYLMNEPFKVVASYTFSTVPMYVLMAQFILGSGIVRIIYALVFKIGKNNKGILGALTLVIGGFLGAVSGSGTATAAALAKISGPELRSRGYSPALAASVTACAGALSAIIPPSMMLVVYSSYSQDSIGKLFMASLIPGILTTVVFIATAFVLLETKSEKSFAADMEMIEEPELVPWKVVVSIVFFAALVITIFGGIYSGLMTPTEAGAVGAFVAFIIAIIFKAVNKEFVKNAMLEASKTTVLMMTLVMGGSLFGKVISFAGVSKALSGLLAPMMGNPKMLAVVLGIVYFIIFCILDGTSGYVLTLPIVLPIVQAAGINTLWFGVFITLMATLGGMTPPVGFMVYAAGAVMGDIKITDIFKKAIWFAIAGAIVVSLIMILFPSVATFLPGRMK